jgi:flagellin
LALVVNSNTTSMNARGHLSRTQRGLSSTFGKISSGRRITHAADDAAGLAVAENLKSHSMSARVAARNINDGISVIQTYEGAVNEISDMMKRARELAVQASSETLANEERAYVQDEFAALVGDASKGIQGEVNRIAETTNFNGIRLMTGDPPTGPSGPEQITYTNLDVQAGVNDTANDRITIEMMSYKIMDLNQAYQAQVGADVLAGLIGPGDVHPDLNQVKVDTVDNARKSIYAMDFMLDYTNKARSKVGATQNRLESAMNNIETYTENLTSAESQIRDADFAFETAKMSKFQVMQQAGVAILGQANGLSQAALRLI